MDIVSITLLVACLIVLIIILFKVSKKKEAGDSEIKEALRRQEQALTVVTTKVDMLKEDSQQLTRTVDLKLEQMRATVDEKLQSTLERRLSSSFGEVGKQLESVYKQLGEMQTLAKDVGNLEKVLTNVKTRGIWGELQAERILQDMLLPDQYDKNVITKRNSQERVEFAVKLPGANEGEKIYLPIDAKFPREDYERLCEASSQGNNEAVTVLRKTLAKRVESEAKDIRDKYIDVPYTTDFAILFLPVEGLYAEVLSIVGLQEKLQRDFHVMVTGPATLSGLLNSLQMGFRTLAIEKKSSQVWKLLGEVKAEYSKLGMVLEGIKKKLALASNEIDNAFTRHRAMERCLREVESQDNTQEIVSSEEEK